MNFLSDRKFLTFVARFLLLFGLFYFGTLAVIGLAAQGNTYSSFVAKYLDYVSGIKHSLVWGVGKIAALAGYNTTTEPGFIISFPNKKGVIIAMNCVGYGVYSFWAAYILANTCEWKKKLLWVAGGLLLLWLINVVRITLFLVAINKGWPMPLGIDHHTWFNILAYAAIFILMYFFEQTNPGKPFSKK
jgi:exosortase/archaeosortase family protein